MDRPDRDPPSKQGLRSWEHVREETLVRYKVFDVHRAVRRSPRTGIEIGMFLVRTRDWVNVVAITDDRRLILVRQFRQGSNAFSLEIPGGIIDHDAEAPVVTAARELREETGYVARELVSLGSQSPNPAIFTNRIHTFLATGCVRAFEPELDAGEDLEVIVVPLAEAEDLIRRGVIDNALVTAGLYAFALRG